MTESKSFIPLLHHKPARVILGLALVLEAVVLAVGIRGDARHRALWAEIPATALFLIALVALAHARLSVRRALVLVVGGGLLLQVLLVGTTPSSSDDAYRYGWDAKVQLSGTDPYRYAPSDPALDGLRTTTLFPDRTDCMWKLPVDESSPGDRWSGSCSLINRPTVHTIYPPVAEAAFALSRVLSFGRTDGVVPMQVLGVLGSLILALLLARRAEKEDKPPWTVAVWSWCPVTVVEVANNAHIDWLAALLSVAGLMVVKARPGWGGALVGAAIVTKLYPALLLFSMLRRRPVRVVGAALAVVLLSYLPHVAAVGGDVIGYLPGYLKEEGYDSGGRSKILSILMPGSFVQPVGAVLLLAACVWAYRKTKAMRGLREDNGTAVPEDTAVVVMGVALLITTPSYAWYMLPLLGMVALSARIEWLPLVLGGTFAFLGAPLAEVHGTSVRVVCFAIGGLIGLAGTYLHHRAAPASSRSAAG